MTEEILAKLRTAKTKEEALTILRENHITLTEEDLQAIDAGQADTGFFDILKKITQNQPFPKGLVN